MLATCAVSLMSAAGNLQVGMATIKRALDINPNQSRVLLSAGIAHLHHGGLEEAIYCFQRNLRLSPASPSAYVSLTGVAHAQMALGRFEEALATAEQSLALSADYVPTYWMLTSAAGNLAARTTPNAGCESCWRSSRRRRSRRSARRNRSRSASRRSLRVWRPQDCPNC